jgi:hypothetical protein
MRASDLRRRRTAEVGRMCVLAVTMLLCALAAGCGQTETTPAPGSWLVLLCKASDASSVEPHPKEFYETLFSKSESDLLYAYFQDVSGGTVDVSGSRVYGWFPMPVDTATLQSRRNGAAVTRAQTAQDCKTSAVAAIAATGTVVDPTKYAGVVTVINVEVDSGAAGDSVVDNTVEASGPWFLEHEMLHVLGLDDAGNGHSWRASPDSSSDHVWDHGGDVEYNDCWDIMSWQTCVYQFAGFQTSMGPQGPELQEEYRQKLGWLPSNRIDVVSLSPSSATHTVKLAPVSEPEKPGFLLTRIDLPGRGHYAVEYREKSGFDRGIPFHAVLIREVRQNGVSYLVTPQAGSDHSTGWRKGAVFTDSNNFLRISVDDIVPGEATITVNTAFASGTAAPGALCGDKYRGQIANCPPTTDCMARRTGQLVSIDWFCL